jgi:hypothetical protein
MHAASSCQTSNPPTKTETGSDAPSCRIIPQDKSTRRCLERWCCRDRVSWWCLLAFWMMTFRDSNCSAIRHSEKVSIREGRQKASKRPWCGFGCEWRTKKTASFIKKNNRAKDQREMQLRETSRQRMAKQHAISFVPEIN